MFSYELNIHVSTWFWFFILFLYKQKYFSEDSNISDEENYSEELDSDESSGTSVLCVKFCCNARFRHKVWELCK